MLAQLLAISVHVWKEENLGLIDVHNSLLNIEIKNTMALFHSNETTCVYIKNTAAANDVLKSCVTFTKKPQWKHTKDGMFSPWNQHTGH